MVHFGEVHYDSDESWNFEERPSNVPSYVSETNFYGTALHEFGHTLGLEHSNDPDSIMVFYYKGVNEAYLSPSDQQQLRRLYSEYENLWNRVPVVQKRVVPPPNDRRPKVYVDRTRPPVYQEQRPNQPVTEVPRRMPEKCSMTYDAIVNYRSEIFIFKDHYFWRPSSTSRDGYDIQSMWKFPVPVSKIDAAYEDCDQNMWFFIGQKFYVFTGNQYLRQGFLTDLGISGAVRKIDAVFTLTSSENTYMFSGSNFWK